MVEVCEGSDLKRHRWWNEPGIVESISLSILHQLCQAKSAADVRSRTAGVLRGTLPEEWLGWDGRIAMISTASALSFFASAHEGQTAFSRERHGAKVATIQPSLDFWAWLVTGAKSPWQLRGMVAIEPSELAYLLGPSVQQAVDNGGVQITQASLWAGAGGTRTPLHVDSAHALIYQIEGSKRFFLSSREDVEAAVLEGTLPEAVRDKGGTDAFCLDGSLNDVYGLSATSPSRVKGSFVTVHRGDCLILPGGLFHDVESAPDAPASMSLTIRFELAHELGIGNWSPWDWALGPLS